ncbi:MAG TPA: hypothetical protein VFE62_15480 [Gemmataceae bacterium]|nr:hypothetical protein [Gemmataceae bacterium]
MLRGYLSGFCVAGLLVLLTGCSSRPTTYPVRGRVQFNQTGLARLAGGEVICQLEKEPFLQASGVIQPDGTFSLQTRHKTELLPGVPKGTYRAWISLPSDKGSVEALLAEIRLDPRYLGKSSPLTFAVPTPNEVVLTVTEEGTLPPVQPPAIKCGESVDPESQL